MGYPPLKQLIIYLLPIPKGVPTARELLGRIDRAQWEQEAAVFPSLLERFASRPAGASLPAHPAFGALSRRAWGVLAYRHVDHHFTQFGVAPLFRRGTLACSLCLVRWTAGVRFRRGGPHR